MCIINLTPYLDREWLGSLVLIFKIYLFGQKLFDFSVNILTVILDPSARLRTYPGLLVKSYIYRKNQRSAINLPEMEDAMMG